MSTLKVWRRESPELSAVPRFRCFLLTVALPVMVSCAAEDPKPETANFYYYSVSKPVPRGTVADHLGVDNPADACIRNVDQRERVAIERWSLPRELVRDWLKRGVESRFGLDAEYTEEPPLAGGYLVLETLYIRRVAATMTAVTVLRAHGSERSTAVRGNSTISNSIGGDLAASRVLSESLDAAMKKLPLQPLINRNCGTSSTSKSVAVIDSAAEE